MSFAFYNSFTAAQLIKGALQSREQRTRINFIRI
jgi:hypothetical protein